METASDAKMTACVVLQIFWVALSVMAGFFGGLIVGVVAYCGLALLGVETPHSIVPVVIVGILTAGVALGVAYRWRLSSWATRVAIWGGLAVILGTVGFAHWWLGFMKTLEPIAAFVGVYMVFIAVAVALAWGLFSMVAGFFGSAAVAVARRGGSN